MNRRMLIRTAIGASLAAYSGVSAFAADDASPSLDALLQRLAEEYLQRSPEEATQYEFDVGANAHLRSQLDDRSLSASAKENAGERPMAAEREIDRYCVYPGQACSFMVGATEIRAARERARQRMSSRFDVRAFHDLVLRSGPVPLDVLHSAVDQWSMA